MSKKGRKMATADNINEKLDNLTNLVTKLNTEVGELKKKVDGDTAKASDKGSEKGSDKESEPNFADLAALLPLCGIAPLGFGGSLLFPLGLRMGAARALALGHALEHAAKVSSQLTKTRDGSAGMPDIMQQFFKTVLSQAPDERRILAEFLAKLLAGSRA
jgi:hypothetical protein